MSQAAILQLLEQHPRTERELVGALGITPESVRIACTKMEKRGQIHVCGYVRRPGYRWPRIWALGAGKRASKNDPVPVQARRFVDPSTHARPSTKREDQVVEQARAVGGTRWWGAL